MPSRPSSPISSKISTGKRCSRSRSWAPGWMRSSAKRRICSRSSSCSSVSPKSTLELTAGVSVRTAMSGLEDPVGDHHLLDLAGPLVDLEDARVAEEALDVVLLGVAIAAVDLESLVGDPLRHLGGEELGLRRFEGEALLVLLRPGGLPGHQASGVDLGRHVGQVELDGLELGELLVELLALLGVGQGLLERALGDAHGLRGDADASAVQSGHGDLEALPFLAQAPARRDAAVVEGKLGGSRGIHPQLELVRAVVVPR